MPIKRPHYDQIALWISDRESRVYRREPNMVWKECDVPSWQEKYFYITIPPHFQHIWDAYLADKLEVKHCLGGKWVSWSDCTKGDPTLYPCPSSNINKFRIMGDSKDIIAQPLCFS